MIGGHTTYDENHAVLAEILAEWITDRDRRTRMQNLTDGTGSVDRLNGEFFVQPGVTVLDDEADDLLFGLLKEDWLFDEQNLRSSVPSTLRHVGVKYEGADYVVRRSFRRTDLPTRPRRK